MRLTQKHVPFVFRNAERDAFSYLKSAFASASILTHWIPDHPIIVETDASDYVLAAKLSIELENGEIHPVTFHSCSFIAVCKNVGAAPKMATQSKFASWYRENSFMLYLSN